MCDRNGTATSDVARDSRAVSSSSFSLSRSSFSARSSMGRSQRHGFVRGSESEPAAVGTTTMTLATGERLYRCLGQGRAARVGDVLLCPDAVSRSTLRRWQRSGWIVHRDRVVLTARGCAALPVHQAVVGYAERVGRSTLFL